MIKSFSACFMLLVVGTLFITTNSKCPVIYNDFFQQENSFQLCSSANIPGQFSNQTSSFYVTFGYLVTLYTETNFGGQNVGRYSLGAYNVPNDFFRQISSVRVSKIQDQNCVAFFTESEYQGDTFQLCSSGDIPSQWNGQVDSVIVPYGYAVKVYSETGYRGKTYNDPYTAGPHNVVGSLNSKVGSFIIFPVQNQDCITFYTGYNQQGRTFQMRLSRNVPIQWNNQASSFVVPSGYSVQLFEDNHYEGDVFGPYAEGTYNIQSNFKNELSSVLISQVLNPNCATFYTKYDQKGSSFQVCYSGYIPYSFQNEIILSFTVPSGYSATLYTDNQAIGAGHSPYTEGSYNLPREFGSLTKIEISPVQNPGCLIVQFL